MEIDLKYSIRSSSNPMIPLSVLLGTCLDCVTGGFLLILDLRENNSIERVRRVKLNSWVSLWMKSCELNNAFYLYSKSKSTQRN